MEHNAQPVCIFDDKVLLGYAGRQAEVARMMWWTIIWNVGDDIFPWIYLIITGVFSSAVDEFMMVSYTHFWAAINSAQSSNIYHYIC